MSELSELRAELDLVDRELVRLFEKRMELARQVAAYKIAKGLPVLDASREEQVLQSRVAMLADHTLAKDVRTLYTQIMALSRGAQEACLKEAQGCD